MRDKNRVLTHHLIIYRRRFVNSNEYSIAQNNQDMGCQTGKVRNRCYVMRYTASSQRLAQQVDEAPPLTTMKTQLYCKIRMWGVRSVKSETIVA
ncbi:hypothetical protein J6590_048142 [Homalodisca vitripennis]|nr:hypothetical protein J6590_048142 [Homalodisca vitripennis]